MPQIIVKGVSASRMEKLASPMIETVSVWWNVRKIGLL